MTRVLERRVLPNQAKDVRAAVQAMAAQVSSGDLLNLGDQGKAVVALQAHLKAAGLYSGPANGTFDAATEAAVKLFQKAKGLPETGTVNRATLRALKAINVFVKDGFATAAREGQRGSDIASAERKLAKLGFLSADKVDGIYDRATSRAVERYRKADKQVGDKGAFINANLNAELAKAAKEFRLDPFRRRDVGTAGEQRAHQRLDERVEKAAKRGQGIGLGAKGAVVTQLERHLRAAGFDVGAANESFNSRTEAAVREFQRAMKLPETGRVDAKTWNRLRGRLFAATSGTSPAMREGEQSGAVLRMEKLLGKLGYKVKADGRFTEQTERAVKAFQRKHDLDAHGRVGEGTLNRIEQAVKSRGNSAFVNDLLKLARSQLGVRETPMGSNVQKYSKFFGRPPEAWCADFVSWLYTKTAQKHGTPNRKLNEPWTVALLQKLKANGTFNRNSPKPGDIILYDWSPTATADPADHTGIVEKVFKRNGRWYVQTIEGNWGNKVSRRVVPLSDPTIRGFGTIR